MDTNINLDQYKNSYDEVFSSAHTPENVLEILKNDNVEELIHLCNLPPPNNEILQYIFMETKYNAPKCSEFAINYFLKEDFYLLPPHYKTIFLEKDTQEKRLSFIVSIIIQRMNVCALKVLFSNFEYSMKSLEENQNTSLIFILNVYIFCLVKKREFDSKNKNGIYVHIIKIIDDSTKRVLEFLTELLRCTDIDIYCPPDNKNFENYYAKQFMNFVNEMKEIYDLKDFINVLDNASSNIKEPDME